MMQQEINRHLPEGSFRIICKVCKKIFESAVGGIAEWAIAASKSSEVCPSCGGDVVLEANPKQVHNKYDAEHPYPENK